MKQYVNIDEFVNVAFINDSYVNNIDDLSMHELTFDSTKLSFDEETLIDFCRVLNMFELDNEMNVVLITRWFIIINEKADELENRWRTIANVVNCLKRNRSSQY